MLLRTLSLALITIGGTSASPSAVPALRANFLETSKQKDPQCAGRRNERAPTEKGVAASALWCLCNDDQQVIKMLERCENKGGNKVEHCMFDPATATCVPRIGGGGGGGSGISGSGDEPPPAETTGDGGGLEDPAQTQTAATSGELDVPEPGCAKRGLMPCGTGIFGLPRTVEHEGQQFCCPAATGGAGAAGAAGAATTAAGVPSGVGGCAFTKYWAKVDAECKSGKTSEAELCGFAAKCASGGVVEEQPSPSSGSTSTSSTGCASLSGRKDECCAKAGCGYSGFNSCLTVERLTNQGNENACMAAPAR